MKELDRSWGMDNASTSRLGFDFAPTLDLQKLAVTKNWLILRKQDLEMLRNLTNFVSKNLVNPKNH